MKTIGLLTILLLVGCASVPHPPDMINQYNRIKAGSLNADGVNREWDGYYAADKEYNERVKNSVVGPILVGAILTAVSAACTPVAYGPYSVGGHLYPGKAIVNTIPTTGGGSMSTVKWYR